MSRFTINMSNQTNPVQAVVGFDDRLDEFFLDVYQNGEMRYTGMSEVCDKDSFWLGARLAAFDIVLPADVYSGLMFGAMGLLRAFNAQNSSAEYNVTELTPLQAQLVKMKGMQVLQSSFGGGPIPTLWLMRPKDDEELEVTDLCCVSADSTEVAIPLKLVPQFAEPMDALKLTDAELLELLQNIEPAWEADKPSFDVQG